MRAPGNTYPTWDAAFTEARRVALNGNWRTRVQKRAGVWAVWIVGAW